MKVTDLGTGKEEHISGKKNHPLDKAPTEEKHVWPPPNEVETIQDLAFDDPKQSVTGQDPNRAYLWVCHTTPTIWQGAISKGWIPDRDPNVKFFSKQDPYDLCIFEDLTLCSMPVARRDALVARDNRRRDLQMEQLMAEDNDAAKALGHEIKHRKTQWPGEKSREILERLAEQKKH